MERYRDRFLLDQGRQIYNGNELLVKGAFETPGGVHLLTGYPGSPVATFFDVLGKLADVVTAHGVCARIANNEAISVAMVNGSQMSPLRAMTVIKSVGGHVASDGLALGNLAGTHPDGGAVIVFGDDPWSESTQVPADSRFLCQHLSMPVLQPANPQEVKDFVPLAFQLSGASTLYIGYIITTTLADGGGTVEVYKNHWPEQNLQCKAVLDTGELDLESKVLLPPRTGRKEVQLPQRFADLLQAARRLNVNPLEGPTGPSNIGFVACGMAYQYLRTALGELGLDGKFPILKLGLTYPIDEQAVGEIASRVEHLLVLEERRSFVEQQVAAILTRMRQADPDRRWAMLWGKQFPDGKGGIPDVLGLHPSIVLERLIRFFTLVDPDLAKKSAACFDQHMSLIRGSSQKKTKMIPRLPTFCPGCPHRDSANVLLEIRRQFLDENYMRKRHRRGPVDLVFHGDTGCYTMLMFPPYESLMHNYSGMGLGGATGAGIDPFITNKQVVFMGDSTFFHSGQLAISNSIKAGQDITYIILDNRTTAMTGHQPTPNVDVDLLGKLTPKQDIEQIVRSVTASADCPVVRADPGDRKRYKKLLEDMILADGVKVVIADKECGIITHRRNLYKQRAEMRKTGYVSRQSFMNITPELCEYCLECTTRTGCPGLNIENTPYGPKIVTDLSWCVNDGACAKLAVCPCFEEVIVLRKRPPRPRGHQIKFERLPEPKVQLDKPVWRAYLAGIGGMGIGLATAILVRAGHLQGYRILFADKKGLAIRNGGVYSQVAFCKDDDSACQVIPYGQADLLIGLDILEAVRAIDAAMPFRVASEKTAAVINTDKSPTTRVLCNSDDFEVKELEAFIKSSIGQGSYFGHNITAICERLFGTKLYANITMLGLAFQQGLIPVSLDCIEKAISQTIPADFKKNMRAFNLGRKLAHNPELFAEKRLPQTLARTVREKATILQKTRLGGGTLARKYKYLVYKTLRACRHLDKAVMNDIAIRLYDLIQYQNIKYAQTYADRVRRVYKQDRTEFGLQATETVAWNLAKLMIIKDAFYVAGVLTSYEKQRRDSHRYNVNPANGDRLRYRRVFHPRFFGHTVDIPLPHWTMYILKRLKFLRAILPGLRRRERRFLEWYLGLIDQFAYGDRNDYDRYVKALKTVEQVNGYSEYRYPKMVEAQQKAAQILTAPKGPPSPPTPSKRPASLSQRLHIPASAKTTIMNWLARKLQL